MPSMPSFPRMRSCSVRAIDAAAGHFTLKAPDRIYIVSPRERWVRAQVAGEFTTPSLATEGFIHAATRTQVAGVLQRHFAGQSDLLLLEIDATALGDALRYEASPRSGELFPHIYSALPLAAVLAIDVISDSHRPPL